MSAKKKAALLAQEQPCNRAQTKEPTNNIEHQASDVNANNRLRALRLKKGIRAQEMIIAVRKLYPRYDKHLQSKCERTELYGVELCQDAMDTLITKYAPEELPPEKKPEFRNLPCRISCRMTVRDYNLLMDCIREEGFQTNQDWLLSHIKKYLKLKGAYQ